MTLEVKTALTLHSLLTADLEHLNDTAPTDRPLNKEEIDERILRMNQLIRVSESVLKDEDPTELYPL